MTSRNGKPKKPAKRERSSGRAPNPDGAKFSDYSDDQLAEKLGDLYERSSPEMQAKISAKIDRLLARRAIGEVLS